MKALHSIIPAMLLPALLGSTTPALAQPQPAALAKPAACSFPTGPLRTAEETAWRIFVAANCQAPGGQLTWERWTEQTCWVNPTTPGCTEALAGNPTRRFLHGNRTLAQRLSGGKVRLTNDCLPMLTKDGKNPAPEGLKPFVPTNLSADPTFCEEVVVNDATRKIIVSPPGQNGLNWLSLEGQAEWTAKFGAIDFPKETIEIKANWMPADALAKTPSGQSAFDCDKNKPQGVYVEKIEGKCYALVAMHINSRLYPNWLWATFEPQNRMTNPNRCNPALYSACDDPWGSVPAHSTGKFTAISPALARLMKAAGLPPEFANYRMVGAQTEFDQPKANAAKVGNTFTEYNFAVPAQESSCITCHKYAAFNTAVPAGAPPQQNTALGPFPGTNAIGTPSPYPSSSWKSEHFSWLLGFMPAAKKDAAKQ